MSSSIRYGQGVCSGIRNFDETKQNCSSEDKIAYRINSTNCTLGSSIFKFLYYNTVVYINNSIRDASTPQPGETVFNTMRYRSSETVQRSGYFQCSVSYIKVQTVSK